MKRALPDTKVTFFVSGERRQELLLISEPTPWISHWDPSLNRSRQCGSPDCYCCAVGYKKQLRAIVLGVDVRGKEWLLELRERHREQLDRWDSTVGLRIWVKKEGAAKNSPVSIGGIGHEHAIERDISRLVACLGLPAIRVRESEPSIEEVLIEASTSALRPAGLAPSKEPTRST